MFSNKKKSFFKSKIFFVCVAVLVFSFGLWLNYGQEKQLANTQTTVDQKSDNTEKDPSVVDSKKDETGTKQTQESYYLIREVEGVVKIFYCNAAGDESLYEITAIPFDLLSQADQQLFAEGVRIENEEELEGFLENFDS